MEAPIATMTGSAAVTPVCRFRSRATGPGSAAGFHLLHQANLLEQLGANGLERRFALLRLRHEVERPQLERLEDVALRCAYDEMTSTGVRRPAP